MNLKIFEAQTAQAAGLSCPGDLVSSSFHMSRGGEKLKCECEKRSKKISYFYLNFFLSCDIIK
jgi:hypothetical protein